jgi:hypothetical protein
MYDWFNQGLWEQCFSLIDPRLRDESKVQLRVYKEGLQAFEQVYGKVDPWYIRISLHLDASSNRHDNRPFAYVYVVWQDAERGFHMFRERWVKDSGRWFTRVVGLVPNRQDSAPSQA